MTRHFHRFWTGFTIVLSIIFIALFFPLVREKYNLAESLIYTGAGVFVIWGVYFVRAVIFSQVFAEHKRTPREGDII